MNFETNYNDNSDYKVQKLAYQSNDEGNEIKDILSQIDNKSEKILGIEHQINSIKEQVKLKTQIALEQINENEIDELRYNELSKIFKERLAYLKQPLSMSGVLHSAEEYWEAA